MFLDTNVLVSAFTTRGLCSDVLRTVLTEHDLIIGAAVIDELRRVLKRFGLPKPQIEEIVELSRLIRDGDETRAQSAPNGARS